VQLNFAAREVTIKLVYYGPALSGKTTNLKALHQIVKDESRGRLMTLETKDDRTLFFDMLPLTFKAGDEGMPASNAMSMRLKVFTVPGQVLHASTRRLVLQGADGVAFIADSQVTQTENNAASFLDLRDNLKEMGRSIKDVPLIIQFNKRDMPNVRKDAEIEQLAQRGKEPVFTASAVSGEGVLESFFGLLYLTWTRSTSSRTSWGFGLINSSRWRRASSAIRGTWAPYSPRAWAGGSSAQGRCVSVTADPRSVQEPTELSIDGLLRLEDLVDRTALTELTKSFFVLFGIPVRIYSNEGALLADASASTRSART
jgi:mutual gliding-motility protein MglA